MAIAQYRLARPCWRHIEFQARAGKVLMREAQQSQGTLLFRVAALQLLQQLSLYRLTKDFNRRVIIDFDDA
ncbi:hypothetical protein D3C77_186180 [compost metagenome]